MLTGKYVIAGATGLMGTTALARLRDQPGITIKAIYNNREPFIFADNISYCKADLTKADECWKAVSGSDYVLSFAGILMTAPVLAADPVTPLTKNILINTQMLEAAYHADVKKLLFISSSTGYPAQDKLLQEDDMFRGDPAEVYFSVGWMFRYTEILCRIFATKLKTPLPIVVIRPSTIYGEYEDFNPATAHMLPALIKKSVDREEPIEVWGSGEVRRDMIYADDLFDACLSAMERPEVFNVFNVAFGREYSVNELLEIILRVDDHKDASIVYNNIRPITGGRRVLDVRKSQEQLGFKPKTDMETGIRKMVARYKNSIAKYSGTNKGDNL
jgi:GDP-L-fucose synthase